MTVRSRRRFLTLLGAFPIIGGYLLSRRYLMAEFVEEDFVLVHGWILKKTDMLGDDSYARRS